MAKTRVHLLAKELAMETKDLIAQLDKLGIRGRKAQSALEDEEVARVRASLAAQERPQVHVGEEKVVADRMVKAEDQNLGEIEARETVVERRVRANVIRRRTSRVEVPQPEKPAEVEVARPPVEEAKPSVDETAVVPPAEVEEVLPPVAEIETPAEEVFASKPEAQEEQAEIEAKVKEVLPPEPMAEPAITPEATAEKPAPAEPEGPRGGARILGRIDLRRTILTPVTPPVVRRPGTGQAAVPPVPGIRPSEPLREGEAVKPEGGGVEKPVKAGRHKKRVVKKQDVLEFREKELRSGRIPKKKRALPGKEQRKTEITVPKASKRVVRISEVITVGDLSREMGVKAGEVIKKLMGMGMMATINQVLDADTATLIASEFDHQVENVAFDAESALEVEHQVEEPESALVPRSPVVTIMGHVDHGKTSLLDAIRSTNVTAQEHGGITQHIGAYHVQVDGRSVTFLDTPGHEAFTAMRARGAKVTDIVVLVVAADDGVMPQTVEAINHARAAEVPIIVAVNKIDRPEANLERVKRGLSEHGLVSEDWGGDAVFAPVSAKTHEGIPHLLEMLLLQADILELKANPDKLARGTIVEAKLDRGRGPVATVLVQEGTLHVGDAFVAGTVYGRVRAMLNHLGQRVNEAGPAMPVEIFGLSGVPDPGTVLVAVADESKGRQVAEFRQAKEREGELQKTSRVSLEDLSQRMRAGEIKELKVIVKGDVQGSVEALSAYLRRLSTAEVKVDVIHASAGGISETDVSLAAASGAIIIGFNVRPEQKAAALAESESVDIRLYTVIYDAINEMREAMEGMLAPTYREKSLGRAEVRQVFNVSGGTVAGSMVQDGKINRGSRVRLVRDSRVVWEGKVGSLRRFKDDVREVASGYECGIALENYGDVKPGDIIEAFELEAVSRKLGMPTPEPMPSEMAAEKQL